MNILELDEMKQVIKESPATTFLIGGLILSFVGSYLFGDGPTDLDTARLFGSIIPADATTDNFIRTLTYTFHQIGGPIHLLLNLSAIAVTGPFLERVYGPFKYTIFFLVTGVFGGIFVLIFSEANMIVGGASGSAYGLIGLYVGLVLKKSPWIDLSTKNWVWNLLWINIVWTLFVPGISIAGHLGGLFSGIIIAMVTSVNGITMNTWLKGFSKAVFAFALVLILMNIPKTMYPNTDLPFVQKMRQMAGNESAFAMQPIFNDELFYSFSTVDSVNELLKINAEQMEQDTTEGAEVGNPLAIQEDENNLSDTLYYYQESDIVDLKNVKAFTNDIGDFYLVEYDDISIYEIFNDDYFDDLVIEVRPKSIFISGYYNGEIIPGKDSYLEFILIPEKENYLKIHQIYYDGGIIDRQNQEGIYTILDVITTPLQTAHYVQVAGPFSEEDAYEILSTNGYIPNGYHTMYHGLNEDYHTFQVYEDMETHTATYNWFEVNMYTGEVELMF